MTKRKNLTRFQRLNIQSQSFNRQAPTKAEQQAAIEEHLEAFFARGGKAQVLPNNFSARDVARMGVEELHHLAHGKGPGGGRRRAQAR